jgi:hypothetical protein
LVLSDGQASFSHGEHVQLRTYCYLEQLQPRYAAFLGSLVYADLPIEGMTSLFIEASPGIEVYRLVDVAIKSSKARLGAQAIEREFGLFEMHSWSQDAVRDAGTAVLEALGLEETYRILPRIISSQVIKEVSARHAQLVNRFRRGSILQLGETLLVIECQPAAYANLLANEADRQARISVIEVSGLGRYGRVWLSGTEAEIRIAQMAAESAVSALHMSA